MQLQEVINTRKSIRKFKPDKISENLIEDTSEEVITETKSTTGTITELNLVTQNGTTQFFFVLEGDENLYISSISNNSRQIQMSVGNNVSIEYYMSPNEELVGIVSKIEIQK